MVGRFRIQQLLGKVEDSDGVVETLSASDYVTAADIESPIDQQFQDRNIGKASFSKDASAAGRSSISFSFSLDVEGDGSLSSLPEADDYLRCCGMKRTALTWIDLGSRSGDFVHGETVTDGLGWSATVVRDTPEATTRLFLEGAEVGTDPGDTVTGGTSGATGEPGSNNITAGGYKYAPFSGTQATVTVSSAWSAPSVGDTLTGTDATGSPIIAQILAINAADTVFTIEPIQGAFSDGDTVTYFDAAGNTGTATVSGDQAASVTTSMTLQHVIDGKQKTGTGCRGNVELVLTAGEAARLDFNMQGSFASSGDQALYTGVSNVPAANVLRFASAIARIDSYRLPIAEVRLDMGNEIALRRDGNVAFGVRGSSIVDRTPSLSIDPIAVPANVTNYLADLQASSTVPVYIELGSAVGKRFLLYVPALQYRSVGDEDRDGEHVQRIEGLPTDPNGSGDNEFAFYYL